MRFYNIIDEQGRFVDFKVEVEGDGQYDSHTYSTKYVRDVLGDTGTGFIELKRGYVDDLEATLRDTLVPEGK